MMNRATVFNIVLAVIVSARVDAQRSDLSNRDVLSRLPDGPTKRQFIIDCTNCHQFTGTHAYDSTGAMRSRQAWMDVVGRMMGFAGANTGFPIMSSGRTPLATA